MSALVIGKEPVLFLSKWDFAIKGKVCRHIEVYANKQQLKHDM